MQSLSNETEQEFWREVAPLLEDAMGTLSEKDRNAIVLRFFEGKSFQEVASASGASENAAKKRVAYALEKLRKFFAKRGVVSTTAIIAGAIAANSVQAAPAVLAKSVTAVALAKGVAASASTLTLIKGALKLMAYKKTAMVVVGIVAALLVGVTVSIPKARTAIKSLPGRIENNVPGEQRRVALMQQMQAMKTWVWPALMKFSEEHKGQFPKSMEDLRSYLPAGLPEMDDSHWRITAGDKLAKPKTPEQLTFCEQINQPAGQARIVLYADGHVEYRK